MFPQLWSPIPGMMMKGQVFLCSFVCLGTVGTEWQWWNCWAKFKSENITDPEGPKTSLGNMVKCRSSLQHTFNSQTKTDRDQ